MKKLFINFVLLFALILPVDSLFAIDLFVDPDLATNNQVASKLERHDLLKRARGFKARGDDTNLLLVLNHLIVNYPEYAESYHMKGELLLKNNDLQVAESIFRKLLQFHPNDKIGLEMLGQIRYQLGDKEETQKLLLQAEQQGGGLTRDSNKMLAGIYEQQGQCDKALSYISRSSGMHQSNQAQLEQAMMVQRCMGDNAKYIHGNINVNIDNIENQSRRFNNRY